MRYLGVWCVLAAVGGGFAITTASGDVADPASTLRVATAMMPPPAMPAANTAIPETPVAVGLIKDECSSVPIFASTGGPPTTTHFEIGDKLKLQFYEFVKDVEATNKGDPNFQQRPEFSGEFVIQDDGTLSLPLLGVFKIAGQSTQFLQTVMSAAFEKLTGSKGFVTVMSIERPPVFVMGPVKTPGQYKYLPGMTVLHVVALAGGFDKTGGNEPWQKIEAVRATIGVQNTMETMTEALARVAVLKAERDNLPVQVPAKLTQLLGDNGAQRLIAVETQRRAAIVLAHATQIQIIQSSIVTAQQEVDMMSRHAHPFAELAKMRGDRAAAMQDLQAKGIVNRNYMIQAQGELADTEQREQDSINQLALAKQRVSQLQRDVQNAITQQRLDLDTAIVAGEREISTTERDTLVNTGVLEVLNVSAPTSLVGTAKAGNNIQPVAAPPGMSQSPQQPSQPQQKAPTPTGVAYEIVRQTANGPVVLAAHDITVIDPGDLIRIVTPTDLDRDQATHISTVPLPKGCAPIHPQDINYNK
jgi:protein involved in polysaccharide export with SLBB domain